MSYKILWCGILFRILLLCYSFYHDRHLFPPFTDIDYLVYTDAAREVLQGNSPYLRPTYRYTPVIAYLCTLNELVFNSAAKVIFCICDIITAKILIAILSTTIPNNTTATVGSDPRTTDQDAPVGPLPTPQKKDVTGLIFTALIVFLFHPLLATISVRGSADILPILLCYLLLYTLLFKRIVLAGIIFGFAVHLKIFPIVFSLAIYFYLCHSSQAYFTLRFKLPRFPDREVSLTRDHFWFYISAFTAFVGLLGLFYLFYGWPFIYETYLYHFVRLDIKHNFSIFFLPFYYIASAPTSPSVFWQLVRTVSPFLSFLPQVILIFVISRRFYEDLALCFLLLTWIFVIYNKVITAQYFLWFWSFLPLILSQLTLSNQKAFLLVALWFSTQFAWLYWAYYLEFKGENSFLWLFLASISFFVANVYAIVEIIRNTNVNNWVSIYQPKKVEKLD